MSKDNLNKRIVERIKIESDTGAIIDLDEITTDIAADIRELYSGNEVCKKLATYLFCTVASQMGYRSLVRSKKKWIQVSDANRDQIARLLNNKNFDLKSDEQVWKALKRQAEETCPGQMRFNAEGECIEEMSIEELLEAVGG